MATADSELDIHPAALPINLVLEQATYGQDDPEPIVRDIVAHVPLLQPVIESMADEAADADATVRTTIVGRVRVDRRCWQCACGAEAAHTDKRACLIDAAVHSAICGRDDPEPIVARLVEGCPQLQAAVMDWVVEQAAGLRETVSDLRTQVNDLTERASALTGQASASDRARAERDRQVTQYRTEALDQRVRADRWRIAAWGAGTALWIAILFIVLG